MKQKKIQNQSRIQVYKENIASFLTSLPNIFFQNKAASLLILVYSAALLSIITWGIPNALHPFNYHMDEWHQMQAVRALFRHGTPNISGSAHGSILSFLIAGLYLIPFTVLRIINPFSIHSSVENLAMQERIFIILRTDMIIFGVLTMITIAVIAKKYLRSNSFLAAFLLAATPLWIALSNYFKYDIPVTFWITVSLLSFFRYSQKPTLKNYLIAGIIAAFAFATKVSAAPIILLYIVSFFFFTPQWRKKIQYLGYGILLCGLVCLIFGIPDILFRWNEWKEFITINISTIPKSDTNNLVSTQNVWVYHFLINYPRVFGYGSYCLFLVALFSWCTVFLKQFWKKKNIPKNELFLFVGFCLFAISLIPLKLDATGDKLLVVLPFLVLLSLALIRNVLKQFRSLKPFVIAGICLVMVIQLYCSSLFIIAKYRKSTQQASSEWIVKNIPAGTTIGIENIPIYQNLPNVVLYEFYKKQERNSVKTRYTYQVIDSSTKKLPPYIIITNRELDPYLKQSAKKELIKRISAEKYSILENFEPTLLHSYFQNYFNMFVSGLNVELPISVYKSPRG